MLPDRPDDKDKVQIGDFVRLCNCEEYDDEICLKIHHRGIFLGKWNKSLDIQTDLFEYWTIFEKVRSKLPNKEESWSSWEFSVGLVVELFTMGGTSGAWVSWPAKGIYWSPIFQLEIVSEVPNV